MAKELIVTSVPKGLFPGTYGFCIVAIDQTINEKTARSLEAISGYRQIESSVKPIAFSYYEYAISGEKVRVLSRVEDAGLDYSNRTNKLARHLILSAPEVLALSSGPATVCASPRTFARWTPNDSPRYLPSRPIQNPVNFSARSVKLGEWNRLTGDPGWAGLLASTVATERPVNLVVKPECNVLRLYEEALALLPPDKRWKATFSTYYTTTPPDVRCQWKALVEGAYDDKVLNNRRALLIDLTGGELGPVEQIGDPQTLTNDAKALVEIARGKRSLVAAPTRRGERESEAGLHLLEDDDTADFYSSINEGVRATRGSREALRNATEEFRDPNEIYDVTEGDPRSAGRPRVVVTALPEEERPSYWWVWLLAGFVASALIALGGLAIVARSNGKEIKSPTEQDVEWFKKLDEYEDKGELSQDDFKDAQEKLKELEESVGKTAITCNEKTKRVEGVEEEKNKPLWKGYLDDPTEEDKKKFNKLVGLADKETLTDDEFNRAKELFNDLSERFKPFKGKLEDENKKVFVEQEERDKERWKKADESREGSQGENSGGSDNPEGNGAGERNPEQEDPTKQDGDGEANENSEGGETGEASPEQENAPDSQPEGEPERTNEELVDDLLKCAGSIADKYEALLDEKKKLDELSAFASAIDKENLVAVNNLVESLRLFQERKDDNWDDYKGQLDRLQSDIESFDTIYQVINDRLINKKASDKEVNDRIQADPNALGERFKDLFKEVKPEESLIKTLSDKIKEIKNGVEKARQELETTIKSIGQLTPEKVNTVLTEAFISSIVSSKLIDADMSVPRDEMEEKPICKRIVGSSYFTNNILCAFVEYVCKSEEVPIEIDLRVSKGMRKVTCSFDEKVREAKRYLYRDAKIDLGRNEPQINVRLFCENVRDVRASKKSKKEGKERTKAGIALFLGVKNENEQEEKRRDLLKDIKFVWSCEGGTFESDSFYWTDVVVFELPNNPLEKKFLKDPKKYNEVLSLSIERLGIPLDRAGLLEYVDKVQTGNKPKPICYMTCCPEDKRTMKQDNGRKFSFSMNILKEDERKEDDLSQYKVRLNYNWKLENVEDTGVNICYKMSATHVLFKSSTDNHIASFEGNKTWIPKEQELWIENTDLRSSNINASNKDEAFNRFCCEKVYAHIVQKGKSEQLTLPPEEWTRDLAKKIKEDWNDVYSEGFFRFYEIDVSQLQSLMQMDDNATFIPDETLLLNEVRYNAVDLDAELYKK